MDKSSLFGLNLRDLVKSLINTAFTAVFTAVGLLVKNKMASNDLTITSADVHFVLFFALFTFLGTLSHRWTTDEQGKFLGVL